MYKIILFCISKYSLEDTINNVALRIGVNKFRENERKRNRGDESKNFTLIKKREIYYSTNSLEYKIIYFPLTTIILS